MSGRWLGRRDTQQSLQQRLPLTNEEAEEASEVASDSVYPFRIRSVPRGNKRSLSTSSSYLSSSVGQRQPVRSFYHYATHGEANQPRYSSPGVREQTQELASWVIGERQSYRTASPRGNNGETSSSNVEQAVSIYSDSEAGEPRTSTDSARPGAIEEVSEPASPEEREDDQVSATPVQSSALSNLIRRNGLQKHDRKHLTASPDRGQNEDAQRGFSVVVDDYDTDEVTETTALLPQGRLPSARRASHYKHSEPGFAEQQRTVLSKRWDWFKFATVDALSKAAHPRHWDLRQASYTTIGAFSAVFLGLLLNVLDALSYGMILFPMGEKIFDPLGPDGVSMFYVSCIVSQLTYSLGGSAFKGGVGSEMIELVPFFHNMAYIVLNHVGDDNPQAVLATVVTAYALSSVLTGLIFFLLGALRLGDLVNFFPRSILHGCIGGVGVFLFLTGIEVSAGLKNDVEWNLDVLEQLFSPHAFALWSLPLALSVLLLCIQHLNSHPVVIPLFFSALAGIFYGVFAALPNVSLSDLRASGWVFAASEADVPFYNFYTYYNFKLVNWEAIGQTLPTMLALSFFAIIHVPINIPSLGLAVDQEDVDVNRELIGHGLSNAISGFCGSIQNYLVFVNSKMFIDNGGNSRGAGVLLAFATIGVWIAGPAMIGYIPKVVVGTLIFVLGIELLKSALWDVYGRVNRLEYTMVLAITLAMGFYDFVDGIVLGIVLACLNFVVQTSQVSAIRATYSGAIAESTVRRHPNQRWFLREVGSQIKVMKLSGFLFFGTIVAVEKNIRNLIDEEAFSKQPIRYLILDFDHVFGLDFSAAEAFVRMDRILKTKGVDMLLSGLSLTGEIAKSLTNVGLFEVKDEKSLPPPVFEDLNIALTDCENQLLLAFIKQSEKFTEQNKVSTMSMTIPRLRSSAAGGDASFGSPRRGMIQQAAAAALIDSDHSTGPRWQNFAQPLPLFMQTFKDLTDKDIDFWHRATAYFVRREFQAGTILYTQGDEPDGFYVLEEGILRADYVLEQGHFHEDIFEGTTCGELPFFSDSARTATVCAEKDCIAWLLTKDKWRELETKLPDVATELLKVSMKLTNERMNTITSYVLVTAS